MGYKAVSHLDHADMLEVAVYRKDHPFDKEPISSITVECTKCGEVVEEVYSADDDNTHPLDCELPEADRRTWEEGVQDAVRIVQNEIRHKKALHHPPQTSMHPAVFETLNEVELHLAALLSRGSYESHDTMMQGMSANDVAHREMEVQADAAMFAQIDAAHAVGDPQPVPCPDCGTFGSVDCPTCQGNARWAQNEVQFARLLCEIVAAYDDEHGNLKHLLRDCANSMNLAPDQVNELFDRAEQVWEKAKAEVA